MAYTNPMPILEGLRDLLGAVTWGDGQTVKTAKVGLEAGMTADDYPIVRIVPSSLRGSRFEEQAGLSGLRQTECLIYFGEPVTEADGGLEELYRSLFAMELALIQSLPTEGEFVAQWEETITDEDRTQGFKLMALRVLVDG